MRQAIKAYYRDKGLDKENDDFCPSVKTCKKSCEWGGRREFIPAIGAYVGEKYSDLKVLFVGINTRQEKALSFDAPYKYGWFNNLKTKNGQDMDGALNNITQKLARFKSTTSNDPQDLIAFTNAVKCSAIGLAGAPTEVMCANCIHIHGYLFDEIEILKPELIMAFGEIPFSALLNKYIADVSVIDENFKDWIFLIENETIKIVVIKLYNPGQGYRTPRDIYKKIKNGRPISSQWTRFMPDIKNGKDNLTDALLRKYADANHIDPNDLFYDAMFDKLIEIAGRKIL